MSDSTLRTPVVLLIFNRPDTTAKVFETVAAARPRRLLVVADGPRPDRPGEAEACATARAVTERVDWPCEVGRQYSETNLGCARRVSSGLNWVFEQVEEAIVLEDDCVPHPTFFPFCEELLERYRDDERVVTVGGCNFQQGRRRAPYSYYFSIFNHLWGWASWRRAWRHFDLGMASWPEIRDGGWLRDLFGDASAVGYWTDIFERAYHNEFDSWGYPWMLSCWARSGLTVLPNVNLVSNIGFDARATHTRDSGPSAPIQTAAMEFPLKHPPFVIRDVTADRYTLEAHFGVPMHLRTRRFLERACRPVFSLLESRPYRFLFRQAWRLGLIGERSLHPRGDSH
jgi:hypothetical protein